MEVSNYFLSLQWNLTKKLNIRAGVKEEGRKRGKKKERRRLLIFFSISATVVCSFFVVPFYSLLKIDILYSL
jgi:hypothetical protein